MNYTLLIFLSVCLISCKVLEDRSPGQDPFVSIGDKLEKSSSYTDQEQEIVAAICNSFQYKRENFPYSFWNHFFEYKVESRECGASKVSSSGHQLQFGLNLSFVSESKYPFQTIQTDQSGFLSHLCEQYLDAGLPINILNTVAIGFSTIQQINLKHEDGSYKIFVKVGTRSSDGSYYVTLVDEITVRIDQTTLNGLVTQHNQIGLCPSGKEISSIFSTFVKNSI